MVKTEVAEPSLEDIPIMEEFLDVFLVEILGMPPLREVEFCIDLALGPIPISKAPY